MASYRFRRRLATLFVAAASALTPTRPPRAAVSRSAAVAELPTSVTAKTDEGPIAVMLLNLGGPETLADVEPFLYNLFADPDIIRLPPALQGLQPGIAKVISALRAPKSREAYEAIGGGSPLRPITEDQGAAVQRALERRGQDAAVYLGMRYWYPFTEDAVQQIKRDGITNLVILPLYPQFSISTSGSSLRLLESIFQKDPGLRNLKHTVIPSWYQRPGYVSAMSDLIQAELAKFAAPDAAEIFFSAHGVPKSYVDEAGDPYREEMEQCVDLIMAELRARRVPNPHTLAYQSRVGPVEWLKPYTDDSIRALGAEGKKAMLAVPISFVSEHIETLEEIDMEYRELAEESGIEEWGRVPALNTNAKFIDDLADAIIEALPYVDSVVPEADQPLVPTGRLEDLLETYDEERRALPAPVEAWSFGWTKSAETWNGRFAMLAVMVVLLSDAVSGESIFSVIFSGGGAPLR